jgi:hypothetical protein
MPSLAGSFRKSTPRMPSSANEAKSVHENDEDMQEANHADASVSLRQERQELTDQLTPQELTDLHAQELSEYWTRVNQETADNEAAREWVAWVAFCIRLAERELNTNPQELVGIYIYIYISLCAD